MKNSKRISWMVVSMAFLLLLPFGSCKIDDAHAAYEGTWERTVDNSDGIGKQVLTINPSSFSMTMKVGILNLWLDVSTIEGTYTVNGDFFDLTVTRIGVPSEDYKTMTYYTKADAQWATMLADVAEIDENFRAKFSVSGNQLTVITDDNNDGTYDPIEEGEVFTKK